MQRWLAKGAIQAVCPDTVGAVCRRGQQTMIVHLGKPKWFSPDSAVINLVMTRETFAAGFRLILSRHAGTWLLRTHEMRWIT
jgi:hypothetical protein